MKIQQKFKILACSFAAMANFGTAPAQAQSDPLLGQMMYFAGNFCPRGWANAQGQLLAISSNSALFSLLGTTFGGDGRTTFGLPDLRGRAAIGIGAGPGLSNVTWGQRSGSQSFVLSVSQMPAHNHAVNATNAKADKNGPGGDYLAITDVNFDIYHDGPPNQVMDPGMISNAGSGQAVTKTSPALGMQVCIATQGVFPSRN